MQTHRIEKLPVLLGENQLFGVYSLKDYLNIEKYPNAAVDEHGRLVESVVGENGGLGGNDTARTEAQVSFSLPDGRPATLEVLDVRGRLERSIPVGTLGAGSHRVTVQLEGLPAGVHLLRLSRSGLGMARKIVIAP